MANIVSYVDIIELMTSIAQRHYQINTFFLGRDWEVENNQDVLYPLFQVYPEFAKMPINDWNEYKTLELTLNCKVLDITTPGEENEKDVHSDTLRIAQDIVNELNQHPFYIRSNVSLMEDISFNALEEHKDDITAGWSFSLKLKIINANTFCGMPIAELPGYSANGPTSTGTIVNVQYLTCDTLPDCPTIIDIDLTLVDLQNQIDNIPVGGGETLSQTLTLGNTTGGQYMLSTNNFSRLGLFDNQTVLTYQNLAITANLEHGDYYTQLSYTDGLNSGNFNVQSLMSEIVHSSFISLNAPNISSAATGTNTVKSDNTSYLSKIEIQAKPTKAYVNDYALNQITGYNSSIHNEADATDNIITISSNNPSFTGAQYGADYSANYINRSLVDKAYVLSLIPAAQSLSSVLTVGNKTGNISILSPDAFTFANIFDGYFSVGYDNSISGGYIRGNATEALVQFGSVTYGGMLDITATHTFVNHDLLIDITAPQVNINGSLQAIITFPYFEFTADNGAYLQAWISGGNAANGFGFGTNNVWIDATSLQLISNNVTALTDTFYVHSSTPGRAEIYAAGHNAYMTADEQSLTNIEVNVSEVSLLHNVQNRLNAPLNLIEGAFNQQQFTGGDGTVIYSDGSQSVLRTEKATGEYNQVIAEGGNGVSLQASDSTGSVANNFVMTNAGVFQTNNGSNNTFIVYDSIESKGLVYAGDYSTNFTPESLVSKRYTTSTFLSLAGGTITGNVYFTPLAAVSSTQCGIPYFNTSGLLEVDVADLLWDDTNKRLGIHMNGSVPSAALDVHSLTTQAAQFNNVSASQSSTGGAGVIGLSDPGTAMLSGSRTGFMLFGGATDAINTTRNSAGIASFATENWSGSVSGSNLVFYATANGSNTRTAEMTITDSSIDVANNKITSVANGTTDGDAVNYTQMNSTILAMNYVFSSGLMRY